MKLGRKGRDSGERWLATHLGLRNRIFLLGPQLNISEDILSEDKLHFIYLIKTLFILSRPLQHNNSMAREGRYLKHIFYGKHLEWYGNRIKMEEVVRMWWWKAGLGQAWPQCGMRGAGKEPGNTCWALAMQEHLGAIVVSWMVQDSIIPFHWACFLSLRLRKSFLPQSRAPWPIRFCLELCAWCLAWPPSSPIF